MTGANGGKNLLPGNGATGVQLHRVIDSDDFLPEPFFNRGVTFLQRTEPGPDDFTARRIGAGGN